jgi:hypothetical protein
MRLVLFVYVALTLTAVGGDALAKGRPGPDHVACNSGNARFCRSDAHLVPEIDLFGGFAAAIAVAAALALVAERRRAP